MAEQTLTFAVTVKISNTKGIAHNARLLAENITRWECSPECEGSGDFREVVVAHESGVRQELT